MSRLGSVRQPLPAKLPSAPLAASLNAGYRQGSAPLPDPPVTRTVVSFKKAGMSDTAALQAALAWAHKQPVTDGEGAMPPVSPPAAAGGASLPLPEGRRRTDSYPGALTQVCLLPATAQLPLTSLMLPGSLAPTPCPLQSTSSWSCLAAGSS